MVVCQPHTDHLNAIWLLWSPCMSRWSPDWGRIARNSTNSMTEAAKCGFLPPYSPELQPAEHLWALWPLTNTCLVNRHFADLGELEDTHARRGIALQRRRNLIRSGHALPLVAAADQEMARAKTT